MVFHWRLSDSNSPQVSRTLLSILAVFNNAVIWIVSTRPPTVSSILFFKPLRTVPRSLTAIGITDTFMFHCLFSSLAISWHFPVFSLFFFKFSLFSLLEQYYPVDFKFFLYVLVIKYLVRLGLDDPFYLKDPETFMTPMY